LATASLISRLVADPHCFAGQPGGAQPLDGRFEQARRGRQENRQAPFDVADLGGQSGKAGCVLGVERLVVQPIEKCRHRAAAVGGHELLQRLARKLAVGGIVKVLARGANDLQVLGDQPVGMQRAERWQQHSLGQIAGRAEQQQPVGGNGHGLLLRAPVERPD
jgi:hypothetical protein